jgi:hypothetical protein
MGHLIREIKQHIECEADDQVLAEKTRAELDALLLLPQSARDLPKKALPLVAPEEDPGYWATLFSWLVTHNLGEAFCHDEETVAQSRSLLDEWMLGKIVNQTLVDLDFSPEKAQDAVALLKILVAYQDWFERGAVKKKKVAKLLKFWLKDPEIQEYLRINRYEGVIWFNKEAFDKLTRGLLAIALIRIPTTSKLSPEKKGTRISDCYKIIHRLRKAGMKSGYQVEKLLSLV